MQGVSKSVNIVVETALQRENKVTWKWLKKCNFGKIGGFSFSEAAQFGILNCGFYRFLLEIMMEKISLGKFDLLGAQPN